MNAACLRTLLVVGLSFGSAMAAWAESPAPHKRGGYLAVEDVPKRRDPAMTPDDRAKLVKELSAARDRQAPHGQRGH